MIKNFFIVLLFILITYNNAFSQVYGTIRGVVRDSSSGETIPYATIQIEKTKLGTYANANGVFLLRYIPTGNHVITASAVGYLKREIIVSNMKEGEDISLLFLLQAEAVQLQGVTTTSDKLTEIYQREMSIQVLTQKEIKIMPSVGEKDIFRMMQVLPGVSSTGDVTSQFYVRGGAGDQNLVLYDNMMIYNPFHAFGIFSIFNTDAIRLSEMMTGGFSPEYGGRLSSVMNIDTRDGNFNHYGAKLNIGSSSTQTLLEGPLPVIGGSVMLAGRKSYMSSFYTNFLGKDIPLDFYDLSAKYTALISNEGKFSISALVSDDKILHDDIRQKNYYWKNQAIGASFKMLIQDYYVDVAFSYSKSTSMVDNKSLTGEPNIESSISNLFFDAKAEIFLFEKDMFSYGFSYILPSSTAFFINSSNMIVDRRLDQQDAGFWMKYRLEQIKEFIFDFGVRANIMYMLEDIDYVFEPRLKVIYKPTDFLSLKISASRYFQNMVTTSNEDEIIPLFEVWLPIKSPYRPQKCDEYIGAMDVDVNKNLFLSFQGYFKLYKNLLGYNLDKRDNTAPDFSIRTGRAYGYEFFLKYGDEKLFAWVNYTLSWAKQKSDGIKFSPKYDRRHIINVLGNIKLPYFIDMNVKCEIASGTLFSPLVGYFDRMGYNNFGDFEYYYDNGNSYGIIGSKNAARLPWYHRVDIGFSKILTFWNDLSVTAKLDFINIYNKKNIFYINKDTGEYTYMLPFMVSFFIGIEI